MHYICKWSPWGQRDARGRVWQLLRPVQGLFKSHAEDDLSLPP